MCKHVLKDSTFNSLQDMICLQNSLGGGGEQTHSQPSVYSVVECLIWHPALKYGNNHRHILYTDITGNSHNGTSHFNVYVKRWWHMYLSVKHKFVLINNSNSKLAKNTYMNKTCISIRSIILPLTCWIDICNIYVYRYVYYTPSIYAEGI